MRINFVLRLLRLVTGKEQNNYPLTFSVQKPFEHVSLKLIPFIFIEIQQQPQSRKELTVYWGQDSAGSLRLTLEKRIDYYFLIKPS